METIRILLYTDYSNISQNLHSWGLTSLQQFIKLKMNGLANVTFCTKNRHYDYEKNEPNVNGATPLNLRLLSDFDELWVFGALQANTRGQPHNELSKTEIEALRDWMKTHGVFITGDHSATIGDMTCKSDHKGYINLGAALGRDIPRAGQLRAWDGPPSGCYEGPLEQRDNHNTQEGDDPTTLDNMNLQTDDRPQQLRLRTGTGNLPHRLFWWYLDLKTQQVVPITKFPDHIHEGKLTIPLTLEGDDWPSPSPPPIVVAQGRDKRFPAEERYYDLVLAYDGDLPLSKKVGRIVADTSFHHYINRNLLNIPERVAGNPTPFTALDQIAQYYCNLALWLAPRSLRNQMKRGLFFWAASHPDVLEDKANSTSIVGKTALTVMELEIGRSNLYRLFAPSEYEAVAEGSTDFLSFIFLGDESSDRLANINREAALGEIVQEYHRFFEGQQITDLGWLEKDPLPLDLLIGVLSRVFNEEASDVERFLLSA